MILEAIVTTIDAGGALNVAPMGPQVGPDPRRFVLKPFKTSTTYRNLREVGEGVLHVTDDVRMLALSAIGRLDIRGLDTIPARSVRGRILAGACRYSEFRITDVDDRQDRAILRAEVVAEGRLRDFFGLNRAKHAVVEAAILATRAAFLPPDRIRSAFRDLAPLVEKTGGEPEREAFEALSDYVEAEMRRALPEAVASPPCDP